MTLMMSSMPPRLWGAMSGRLRSRGCFVGFRRDEGDLRDVVMGDDYHAQA